MEQEFNQSPSSEQTSLANALSSLLSNPEMMEKIRALAGQAAPESTNIPSTPTESLPASAPPADGLASVLADPALMAKLPQMMAMLKPMLESRPNGDAKAVSAPLVRNAEDYRNDLLLALKPFLSPERCRAVDTMLRISKLGTVIRQIK